MATQRSVKRRVKVYFLGADGLWQDAGTGYVSVVYSESMQQTFFLVKSDVNESETILESRIAQTDIYQRQHAYIEAQWKVEPNPKAIRRAFVLREAIGLLQTVHENADKVRPILFPNAKKRAR